jgi:hypothetical protein
MALDFIGQQPRRVLKLVRTARDFAAPGFIVQKDGVALCNRELQLLQFLTVQACLDRFGRDQVLLEYGEDPICLLRREPVVNARAQLC